MGFLIMSDKEVMRLKVIQDLVARSICTSCVDGRSVRDFLLLCFDLLDHGGHDRDYACYPKASFLASASFALSCGSSGLRSSICAN